MRIILENMNDVREFLDLTRNAWNIAPMAVEPKQSVDFTADLYVAPDDAKTSEQAAIEGFGSAASETPAEAPKRKRRTKAEMQADAERETGLQQPGTLPEGVGTEPGASSPETAGNAAVQAALAGDVNAATAALAQVPVGGSPFATQPAQVVEKPVQPAGTLPPVQKPQSPEEIRFWIDATAVGKYNAVTPVDHMNLAKTFIGAKGMNAYNESFGLVGLSNNIMGFTSEQRALHAAALDFLDWE